MKLKKLLSLMLVFVLALSISACKPEDKQPEKTSKPTKLSETTVSHEKPKFTEPSALNETETSEQEETEPSESEETEPSEVNADKIGGVELCRSQEFSLDSLDEDNLDEHSSNKVDKEIVFDDISFKLPTDMTLVTEYEQDETSEVFHMLVMPKDKEEHAVDVVLARDDEIGELQKEDSYDYFFGYALGIKEEDEDTIEEYLKDPKQVTMDTEHDYPYLWMKNTLVEEDEVERYYNYIIPGSQYTFMVCSFGPDTDQDLVFNEMILPILKSVKIHNESNLLEVPTFDDFVVK